MERGRANVSRSMAFAQTVVRETGFGILCFSYNIVISCVFTVPSGRGSFRRCKIETCSMCVCVRRLEKES